MNTNLLFVLHLGLHTLQRITILEGIAFSSAPVYTRLYKETQNRREEIDY